MNNRAKIWLAYKQYKMLAYVPRMGFGVCGVYFVDPKKGTWQDSDTIRPESDLEHTAGVMKLVRAISQFYPEIIPKEDIDDYLFGAEIHEIGELISGDTLDDGTRNEKQKDFEENVAIRKYLYDMAPQKEYRRGLEIFEQMQKKNTDFGKTLYMIDKLEAILQAIVYESLGHPGRLDFKKENFGGISDRDKENSEFVGTDNIVDVWTHGFIKKGKSLSFEYLNIFVSIINEAVNDVRKQPFSWIEFDEY